MRDFICEKMQATAKTGGFVNMQEYNVYEDMSSRAGGGIYVGVVGPVRTGKSTFIKRLMERLVIPYAAEGSKKSWWTNCLSPAREKPS